jgi:hypothetical protein
MFSYRPESVFLKRTFTSLSWCAFRRTAQRVSAGFRVKNRISPEGA